MTPSSSSSLSSEALEILKAHLLEFKDARKKEKRMIIASCVKDTIPADAPPLDVSRHRKVNPPLNSFCRWATCFLGREGMVLQSRQETKQKG
jgi:hypothetical protein